MVAVKIAIVLVLFGKGFSQTVEPRFYVFNGTEAKPHSHPWLLYLTRAHGPSTRCGASLIPVFKNADSTDIAVTAAHCVMLIVCGENEAMCKTTDLPLQPGQVVVQAGMHKIVHNEDLTLHSLAVHPKYHPDIKEADVAVIKLATPIKFSETIGSINLAVPGVEIPKDAVCKLAGWGGISAYGVPDQLREGKAFVYTGHPTPCQDLFELFKADKMLCVSGVPKMRGLGCHGDSGGPLICKGLKVNGTPVVDMWYQVGITSFTRNRKGGKCGDTTKPTVFVKVSAYYDWIMEEAKKMTSLHHVYKPPQPPHGGEFERLQRPPAGVRRYGKLASKGQAVLK